MLITGAAGLRTLVDLVDLVDLVGFTAAEPRFLSIPGVCRNHPRTGAPGLGGCCTQGQGCIFFGGAPSADSPARRRRSVDEPGAFLRGSGVPGSDEGVAMGCFTTTVDDLDDVFDGHAAHGIIDGTAVFDVGAHRIP